MYCINILRHVKLVGNLPKQDQDQTLSRPSSVCTVVLCHFSCTSWEGKCCQQRQLVAAPLHFKPGWGPNTGCGDGPSEADDCADGGAIRAGLCKRKLGAGCRGSCALLLSKMDQRPQSLSCSLVWGRCRMQVGSVLCCVYPVASVAHGVCAVDRTHGPSRSPAAEPWQQWNAVRFLQGKPALVVTSLAPGPTELEDQNSSFVGEACFNSWFEGERRQRRLIAIFFVDKQEISISGLHKPSCCHQCGANYINSELLPCLKRIVVIWCLQFFC